MGTEKKDYKEEQTKLELEETVSKAKEDEKSKPTGSTQTIQTTETKILEGSNREVLIGKDIDKIDKKKDGFDTLQKRIMDRMLN